MPAELETPISKPTLPLFDPGRLQECEDAIAGAVTRVMDEAELRGWTIAEICLAMTAFADSVMLHEARAEDLALLHPRFLQRR